MLDDLFHILFCILFYNAVNIIDYIELNGRLIGKQSFWYLDGGSSGLTEVLSWHLPGATEDNHTKSQTREIVPQLRFKQVPTKQNLIFILQDSGVWIQLPVELVCSVCVENMNNLYTNRAATNETPTLHSHMQYN
jgi:hypothetical protein